MFQGGKAFEVEFLIYPDPKAPDYFISVQIPVEANQCEPGWDTRVQNAP